MPWVTQELVMELSQEHRLLPPTLPLQVGAGPLGILGQEREGFPEIGRLDHLDLLWSLDQTSW